MTCHVQYVMSRHVMNNTCDVVEAHCYVVDIRRTNREQIRSRIHNNWCKTEAYVAETFCTSSYWFCSVSAHDSSPDITHVTGDCRKWHHAQHAVCDRKEVTSCTACSVWQEGSDIMHSMQHVTGRKWRHAQHAACDRKEVMMRPACADTCSILTLTRSAQPMSISVSLFQYRWQGEIFGLGLGEEEEEGVVEVR